MKKIDFISFNNTVIDFNNVEVALLGQIKDIFRKLCECIEFKSQVSVAKFIVYEHKKTERNEKNKESNEGN